MSKPRKMPIDMARAAATKHFPGLHWTVVDEAAPVLFGFLDADKAHNNLIGWPTPYLALFRNRGRLSPRERRWECGSVQDCYDNVGGGSAEVVCRAKREILRSLAERTINATGGTGKEPT